MLEGTNCFFSHRYTYGQAVKGSLDWQVCFQQANLNPAVKPGAFCQNFTQVLVSTLTAQIVVARVPRSLLK